MADIEVSERTFPEGWIFGVIVRDKGTESRHSVSLSKQDYVRLDGGRGRPPSDLVRRSFAFLLEREPKESILRIFDLTVISRYFPEYEESIRSR